MTCHEFDTRLAAYAAGTLGDADATAMERHASECDTCAVQMERLPHIPMSTFAPSLPADRRATTLMAVATRRAQRARTRWLGVAGALAAAALVVTISLPGPGPGHRGAVTSATNDTAPQGEMTAAQIAAAHAATEFEAIDAATRELQRALDAAPADQELRAFLASVSAQREQLQRRVRDART